MRLLLDTQAFLYALRDPDALPNRARSALESFDNELLLSVVSPIELQIKVNAGKLNLARPVRDAVQREIDRGFVRLLPITLDHIEALSGLPFAHRDLFDRLLIAQALHENLTIVTGDLRVAQYPAPTLWR